LVLATAVAAWFRETTNVLIEQRNREQGGYRVPVHNYNVEPFVKGEPQPLIIERTNSRRY
jgi:hypothetical protein